MNAPMQQAYRGYPQTAHRPPITPRRPGQVPGMMPMPVAQHGAPPQVMPQRHVSSHAEAAMRRTRKPTDKNMPDGIEDIVIGEGVQQYKRLQDVEKRLDAGMIRKRLDIQDSVNRTTRRYRTLRLWISNTVQNQPWQQSADETMNPGARTGAGRYKVKIEGRLLDDESDPTLPDEDEEEEEKKGEETETRAEGDRDPDAMEEDEDAEKKKTDKPPTASQRKKLSHFFKGVTIEFDKPTTPGVADLATINWQKPAAQPNAASLPTNAEFDSLEFSRAAEVNLNTTINLTRDETPERLHLSKELASVVGVEDETRAGVVIGIWEYVKAVGLQENEEKQIIRCDDKLRSIFGRDKMYFPSIPESIGPHTSPMPAIQLPYTIRVDQEYHNNPTPTIYDIRVVIEDPLRAKMLAVTTSPEYPSMLRQVSSLDDQLALVIQALHHSKAKHSFLTAMSKDPVNFMKRWISSQRRDMETILGESTRGGRDGGDGPEFRRGGSEGAWDTPVAREAVRYLLSRPAPVGR